MTRDGVGLRTGLNFVWPMKLLFSEALPDYARYLYPYVIWGLPEPGETPADFFESGFLPGSPALNRFYLCRQLRVPLAGFAGSSENRRILNRGAGLEFTLEERTQFDYSPARKASWLAFAHERFGPEVMSETRLDTLMSSPVVSHLLVCRDPATQLDAGVALLYLEPPRIAFYYYAFYDLNLRARNLGMLLMTSAVTRFATQGFGHIHLGTCYSEEALYKAQFRGVQFFNGFEWSTNLKELKYLLRREHGQHHLLAEPDFQAMHGGLESIGTRTGFGVRPARLR